nr:MAG TPA: putative zinc finger/helix-turn-helix protein, YgiT family [Caudoviricetes sp.]
MIDVSKLLESTRLEITFADVNVDRDFVKAFRKEHGLTQIALANMLGVTKKTIEKWEQGKNNVGGSSAVLLKLLNDNPNLIEQLYRVKVDVQGKQPAEEYKSIGSTVVALSSNKSESLRFPLVAAI